MTIKSRRITYLVNVEQFDVTSWIVRFGAHVHVAHGLPQLVAVGA